MIDASVKKQIALVMLTIAFLIGVVAYFDLDAAIVAVLTKIDKLGPAGPLLFIAIDCIFVVLLLPGVLLTLGAGLLFGILKGSIYVVVATTLGASLAFLIARHLLSARIAEVFLHHPKLSFVNREFAKRGWRIILLTRLIPFFPFKLSNYYFGFTGFRFGDFLLGTFLGIMPITIFNVYIGSLAGDLATLGVRDTTWSPLQWALYGAGFLVTIIALIYINNWAQKSLKSYLSGENDKTQPKQIHQSTLNTNEDD